MHEETSWLLTIPAPDLKMNLCLSLMSGAKHCFKIDRCSINIVALCKSSAYVHPFD